jgi:hypothetical protein
MHRLTMSLASRPLLAATFTILVAVFVAACKGGGSTGY